MHSRPKLLDLFSGAGGAAVGYYMAGFDVVGVDHKPQPHYPFSFVLADAIEYAAEHSDEFDVAHASPPCQRFTSVGKRLERSASRDYPDLIAPIRQAIGAGIYVIENVPAAPLLNGVKLCGSSFGLDVRRHRIFESNLLLWGMPCNHSWQTPRFRSLDSRRLELASVVGVHGHQNYAGEIELRRKAMGIDWMSNSELVEAIPPAYTKYIGEQLIDYLEVAA